MSTQRRDDPWWFEARMDCADALGGFCLAMIALLVHVCASGRTAPPVFPARLATNSLLPDSRFPVLRGLIPPINRLSLPPFGVPRLRVSGRPVLRAPSPLYSPHPARFECFYPALP